jgi:hypothetical protein
MRNSALMKNIKIVAALGSLVSGLVLAAGVGAASAATASPDASPTVSAASSGPGHTIASAGTLTVGGNVSSDGGFAVDYWKVQLNGGDVVQFIVNTPSGTRSDFDLYPPNTTDATVPSTAAFDSGSSFGPAVFDLQAPYTGTFVLAVCQGPNVLGFSCSEADSGGTFDPMASYKFSTSFATSVSSTVAAKETKASPTIAGAKALGVGDFEAGGGDAAADYWKVQLNGGEVVQFKTDTPANELTDFDLYPPSTSDTTAPATATFSSGSSFGKAVLDLQAPYTGTFVLAVCQGPNVLGFSCSEADSGSTFNPIGPYTFSTSFATSVSSTVAAKETKASPTIAGAKALGVGDFEAGGGDAPVDFWKVQLNSGDTVQVKANVPGGELSAFSLYKQGTNDTNFPAATAVSSGTSFGPGVFDLKAPSTGTFVLAVCQGQNVLGFSCTSADSGGTFNPMAPYTYTTSLTGGHESQTSLSLSASTVTFGNEKALKLTAAVKAVFSGKPSGTVTISAGKTKICLVKLASGKGTCSPGTAGLLAVGKYTLTASYGGASGFDGSSASAALTVAKASTKTALRVSAAKVTFGKEKSEVLTATVTSQFAGLPSGTVTVKTGSAAVCTITLKSGTGKCALSASQLKAGSYALVASSSGDAHHSGSTSGKETLTVLK